MNQYHFSRRKFLSAGAITLSGAMLTRAIPALGRVPGAAAVRVGLIGTGNRGSGIARLIKKIPALELAACCDINPASLQQLMQKEGKGARSYADYRKLLDDRNVEAVIIATPLYLHHPMAMDALQAGKHVYVEKTMTYDIPQALQLVEAVNRSGLVLQVGHQYRYYALYHRVKEVMAQGWLGKVTQFECQYHRNADWRKPVTDPKMERLVNWRMYHEYSGGLMAELCAHQIDMVNYLLDAHPERVVGMGGIDFYKDGRDTYDNVRAVFEYPGGVRASVSSILTNAFKGYSIRVLGTRATLEIQRDEAFLYAEGAKKELGTVDGVTGATVTNWSQGDAVPLPFEHPELLKQEPTTAALADFAARVRDGKTPAASVITGCKAAISVHMANAAMETGNCQVWKEAYKV